MRIIDYSPLGVTANQNATFEITVMYMQNATWQGQILWAERNLRQYFRSVLEMLKLIDEALMDGWRTPSLVE